LSSHKNNGLPLWASATFVAVSVTCSPNASFTSARSRCACANSCEQQRKAPLSNALEWVSTFQQAYLLCLRELLPQQRLVLARLSQLLRVLLAIVPP
jgi:uncharacterized coiled-coil protein SlyX